MSKIKLSLPSGSEAEKSVITYFNNGGNYLVLDGESVGSMGLPIILVSKINDDKAEKIVDQNEWQQVKGYLKNIISGGSTNYLAAPEVLNADEVFCTQLTLPVASFDALKNSYSVHSVSGEAEGIPSQQPSVPDVNSPVPEVAAPPVQNPETTPSFDSANTDPTVDNNIAVSADGVDSQSVSEQPDQVPAVEEPVVESAPVPQSNDMQPVNMSTDAANTQPIIESPAPVPIPDNTITDPNQPVGDPIVEEQPTVNEGSAPMDNSSISETPVIETPEVAVPNMPDIPTVDSTVTGDDVINNSPIDSQSVSEGNPVLSQNNSIDDIKQKFMKACEELFDSIASLK